MGGGRGGSQSKRKGAGDMSLLAIGLGYCARHFVRSRGLAATTLGTTRERSQIHALTTQGFHAAFCKDSECDSVVDAAISDCEALLVSAAPQAGVDPVVGAFGDRLRASRRLRRVVYLSSLGVYGDHQGAWVDEDSALRPNNARSRARANAEAEWLDFQRGTQADVHILRLAGIYGPGRNALEAVARGEARRIVKPGQIFNRIHVEDIARAIEAALRGAAPGAIWNVTDDEPGPPGDPIAYAADLLGAPPPPEIPFEAAEMSAMARSFWGENKRVSNARLKNALGVRLAYPTFREGLRALFEAGEGASPR